MRVAEREAAEAFGADRSHFVAGGTTMANQIVPRSLTRRGDAVLVDGNCHKSVINGLVMTGATPVFMRPNRNGQGLIGPVRASELAPETVRARIARHPLVRPGVRPAAAVLTNPACDGAMYRVGAAIERLGASTDAILVDGAWISHAPFHTLLAAGAAMRYQMYCAR